MINNTSEELPRKKLRQLAMDTYLTRSTSDTGNPTPTTGISKSTLPDKMDVVCIESEDHTGTSTNKSDFNVFEKREHEMKSQKETLVVKGDEEENNPSTSVTLKAYRRLTSNTDAQIESNCTMPLASDLSNFKCAPQCLEKLAPLSLQRNRTILYKITTDFTTYPDPWPDNYKDKWSENYVRMPCSSRNTYREQEESEPKSKWKLITSTLNQTINSPLQLEKAIQSYNSFVPNFFGFQDLIKEEFSTIQTVEFFDVILPGIIRLATNLPKICTKPIPLLKQNMNHTIFISQMQIASLIANAFLCTFSKQPYTYPNINFAGLFAHYKQKKIQSTIEKLKCIINYFRRVTNKDPCGTVSFTRQSIAHFPNWNNCQETLCKLHVTSEGSIDSCDGMLQMDFANKYLGGGVLRKGAVQEEISFVKSPELIVGQLFSEVMLDHECLIIKGAERYNDAVGYASDFKWNGDFIDCTPRDEWGRRHTTIVAIDALRFQGKKAKCGQYDSKLILRELNKAYCGFSSNVPKENLETVATGNWGCGAFGGDPRLKSLIQLMAASKAGRDMVYITFKDEKLCEDIKNMYSFLIEKHTTIGDLWKLFQHYSSSDQELSLYDFMYKTLEVYNCDTDSQDDTVIN